MKIRYLLFETNDIMVALNIIKTYIIYTAILISYGEIDSVMGLGFTATNPDGIDPPIITAIKSGILDSPVVTIFLKNDEAGSSNGNCRVITYGTVDTMNCDRNIVYGPSTNPDEFQVSVSGTSL